ncbi:thiol protease/hemagglutinin PrtT [uncultured Bacteroides sp.]|uniref:thiol protease/hemagglutinin PrtT n=1 Tax=uncultured Bacteroides sp. TaxID=162156 RepID=UPI002AAC330B|nr:thiol protease/hemagglutinin PrtT [uncultured Bacteroides sp.]
MKKIVIFLFLSFCLAISSGAKPRAQQEILSIAKSYFSQQGKIISMKSSPVEPKIVATSSSLHLVNNKLLSQISEYFYIYEETNRGFIIISADDRIKPILGYSDRGSFDLNNIPDNMREWLGTYVQEIESIFSTSASSPLGHGSYTIQRTSFPPSVVPLLGTIQWNQSAPYNNLCPAYQNTKTVTGCVATAMAQIMKYYNYPEVGKYSKNYTTESTKIDCYADFTSENYQWNKMLAAYGSVYTVENANAVATLMYHCGVAVSMDYNISANGGSSASATSIPSAFINYFLYDSNLQLYKRDYYAYSDWMSLIKKEISESRPILYTGQSTNAGHAFVLDGYDTQDLVHINWGWGGSCNGYFEISALDPDTPGIGGGDSGYNSGQYMVIGIQKPNVNSKYVSQFGLGVPVTVSSNSIARSGSFTFIAKSIYNMGTTFSGSVGLVLFKDGQFVSTVGTPQTIENLKILYGPTGGYSFMGVKIPTGIAPGSYQLYIASKDKRETDWSPARIESGKRNYYNVYITDSGIIFSDPDFSSNLNVKSVLLTNKLYSNKTGNYSMKVKNGSKEFNSSIGLLLQSVINPDDKTLLASTIAYVGANEEKEISLKGKVAVVSGEYKILPVYSFDQETWTDLTYSENKTTTVFAEPTGIIDLSLSVPISFEKSTIELGDPLILTAKIKNKGTVYDNDLAVAIFEVNGSSSSVDVLKKTVFIDTDEEQTVVFSAVPNVSKGNYQISLRYFANNSFGNIPSPKEYGAGNFTVVDKPTGIFSQIDEMMFSLYPVPAKDVICIHGKDDIMQIDLFNSSGILIKQIFRNEVNGKEYILPLLGLQAGLYIVRIQTANGMFSRKFTKINE